MINTLRRLLILVAFLCSLTDLLGATVGEEHLVMGNPSNATTDSANGTNYLMRKVEYVLAYNVSNATPNWVSWHLNWHWLGPIKRQDHFIPDPDLPPLWPHVEDNCYDNTGFTRGHMCNSEDRTDTQEHNDHTFYMSNMVPQTARNNEETWKSFETFCRNFAKKSNEVYIVCGPLGIGGTGTKGRKTTLPITRSNTVIGTITVPAYTWKVVIVLPPGKMSPSEVTTDTTALAVLMPNTQTIDLDWKKYVTTIKAVENNTGYNFFSNVDPHVADVLKERRYGPTVNFTARTGATP